MRPDWLREQIAKSVALLDSLPPKVRASLEQPTAAHRNRRSVADPPGSVLRIEGDDDIQTVMAGLDSLTVYGETRAQRQAAYDLLLRLRCRMGSDGRWRQGLPGDSEGAGVRRLLPAADPRRKGPGAVSA